VIPRLNAASSSQQLDYCPYAGTRARIRIPREETNSRNIIGARCFVYRSDIKFLYRKPKRLHRISAANIPRPRYSTLVYTPPNVITRHARARLSRRHLSLSPRAVKAFSYPALTQIINEYKLLYIHGD